MRFTFKTLALAGTIALALPSLANARIYKTTVTAPLTTSVKVEIVMSEDMQHRANNKPTNRRDRTSRSPGVRKGFANNGFYGERELTFLTRKLETAMTRKFENKGISISDDAPVTLRITIEDAKNNRPTHNQLSIEPSLSLFKSFSIGGAEVNAELIDQDGNSLGTMHYKYYENDITQTQQFSSTWYEATRTFERFANNASKTLATASAI